MSTLYLGLDGGGTKTDAYLIDADKNVLAAGHAGGSNATVLGFKQATANLQKAVENATKNFRRQKIKAVLAIASIDTQKDEEAWQKAILENKKLSSIFFQKPQLINDSIAALRSGTQESNALVVISGTGSICFGKSGTKNAKSGGLDYILTDDGSAYQIGLDTLREITKSLDGRAPETELAKLVFSKLNISSLEELKDLIHQKPWDKTDIARIAPLVEKAAKNDITAQKIMDKAANELAQMVKAVAQKLKIQSKQYTVVTTGSVLENFTTLKGKFEDKVLEFSPSVKFSKPQIPSAQAAAYLALENDQKSKEN